MPDEMGLFEAIYNCRAMRRIRPDAVPEELLLKLIAAANQAPSGSNIQNGRWIIVRDAEQKRKLADMNRSVFQAYLSRTGGRPGSLPHQPAAAFARMIDAVRWQADHFAEIPVIVVACLELAGSRVDSFAAGARAGGSIWPGVQNLLLSARALGLAATPTTFMSSDLATAKAILALPESIEPFCAIPVGFPLGNFGPVRRRPVSEIMRWDRWSP